MMRIWCYDDAHKWGQELQMAAVARGHDARLFENHLEPDEGFVFLHMGNHPAVRAHHRRLMQHFATIPTLTLIPSYRCAMLFDDRLEQLRQFAIWMPSTKVFTSPAIARAYIETLPSLPIISKSQSGGHLNVRTLRTHDEARKEIKMAFSDLGIRGQWEQRQHGYLIWQEYVDFSYDYRVLVIGDQRLVLRRECVRDRNVATDFGTVTPVTKFEGEVIDVLDYVDQFVEHEGIKWIGLDVVKRGDACQLIETSVAWSIRKYDGCTFYPDGRSGFHIWNMLVEQIECGVFHR